MAQARKIKLDRQGYDSQGHYWGVGGTLYAVEIADETIHVRAQNRTQAIARARNQYGYRILKGDQP